MARNLNTVQVDKDATETYYQVWRSWEAVTLDYIHPLWYPGARFAERERAEALAQEFRDAAIANREVVAYEVVEFNPPKPEPETYTVTCGQGHEHSDEDSAFSCSYWADRARAAVPAGPRPDEFRGKQVEVVRGRKVPKGTVGEAFWIGEDKFGNGYRVGVKTAQGEVHWTNLANVEVREGAMV